MTPLKFFRSIALAEGISLLVLIAVAMPLKYFLGFPEAVKVVGWIHGLLFVVYVGALAVVHFSLRWSLLFSAGAMLASLVPLGTFVLDKYLRKMDTASAGKGRV